MGPTSGPVVKDAVNRAEFARLLFVALEGSNATSYQCPWQQSYFTDVPKTAWFYKPVCYVYENDIIMGYPNGKFGPGDTVNRAAAVTMLANAYFLKNDSGEMDVPAGNPYTDISVNSWYYDATVTCAALNLVDIKPWTNAKFYPSTLLSKGRAQYWIDKLKGLIN